MGGNRKDRNLIIMIYYIYGTDAYLCQQKLNEIKRGFTEKRDQSGLNTIRLKANDLSYDRFSQEALTVPFLSEKKLIIIEGLCEDSPAGRKKLRDEICDFIIAHADLDNNLLFLDVYKDEKSLPEKDRLFIKLNRQEFKWFLPALKNAGLANWINSYCKKAKINIEPDAISELIILIGNDLVQITNELKKLSAYRDGEVIKVEDIRLLVKAVYDEDVFGLTNALASKDRVKALEMLSRQLISGNEPLSILGSINWQFKSLLKIRSVTDTNPRATSYEIASQTGLHSFVVSKNLGSVNKFSLNDLISILNSLLEIEKKLKSGTKNPELILDMFIAKHC